MNYFKLIVSKSKWTTLSAVSQVLAQALILLIITRFVDLPTLGIFALASSLVFFFYTLLDISFTSSLIHEDNPGTEDYSAVLHLNFLFSFIGFVSCIIAGVLLSYLYNNFDISRITLGLAPILLLHAFNAVQIAGLKKRMSFEDISKIETLSVLFYFLIALLLIFQGFGIWALVIGLVIRHAFVTLLLIKTDNISCQIGFTVESLVLRKHLKYGQFILLEKSFSTFISYIDVFLLNHFLGLSLVGVYDIFKKVIVRPFIVLYTAVENVVFPLLSNHKNEVYKYKTIYNQFLSFSNLFFIPLSIILYINVYWIIKIFPEAYADHVHVFKALCIFIISVIIFNPIDILLYSKGKTKAFMYWMLSYSLPLILFMIFSLQFGLVAFINTLTISYLILNSLAYFVFFRSDKAIDVNKYFMPTIVFLSLFGLVLLIESYGLSYPYFEIISSITVVIVVFLFWLFTKSSLKKLG